MTPLVGKKKLRISTPSPTKPKQQKKETNTTQPPKNKGMDLEDKKNHLGCMGDGVTFFFEQ